MPVHPVKTLSIAETTKAKDIVLAQHPDEVIIFREIFLQEPPKAELVKFLDLEHSGQTVAESAYPARLAKCQYDVIGSDKIPSYHESIVDVEKQTRTKHEIIGQEHHAALALYVISSTLSRQRR